MTAAATDTAGKYVTQVQIINGRIEVTYGDQANQTIKTKTLSLTPYETPDLSVAWRCGSAPIPAGAPNPLGTSAGGVTAAWAASTVIDKYLPKACRA